MTRAMKSAAALLLCACVSMTAYAADEPQTKETGFELGVGVSKSELNLTLNAPYFGEDSLKSTGYKLFAGYRFVRYLAVEAAYQDAGSQSDYFLGDPYTTFHLHPHLATATAVGILPLGRYFSLFARAGEAHWWYTTRFRAYNPIEQPPPSIPHPLIAAADYNSHSDNFIYGGGAAFNVEGAAVRLEYEESKASDTFPIAAGILPAALPVDGRERLISLSVVWTL